MKLVNLSKNTVLAEDLKEAKSLIDQLLGLLKKSNPRSLYFHTRCGIHTFGLKEKIDILVLDDSLKVVKIKTVKPNKLFFWPVKYSKVVELPLGVIKKSQTEIGDKLQLG